MLGAAVGRCDEGQVDLGLGRAREFALALFGRFLQTLQGHRILGEVNPLLFDELIDDPVDDALIKVIAAEMGVAVGRLDLENTVADLEDRDIKGAAAKIKDGDLFIALLVKTIGERGRSGLVDDAAHIEAGDLARLLGRLALTVIEIGGHGDNRIGHFLAEIVFGGLAHLLQDHRRDLLGGVFLVVDLHLGHIIAAGDDRIGDLFQFAPNLVVPAAHKTLDRIDRFGRVGDRLTLGHLADQTLAALGEGNHRGGGAHAFAAGNDDGLSRLHHRNAGVGGAQINTDNFTHGVALLSGGL